MKWYIVFFGSTDYYTSDDGHEIVKAKSSADARDKAIEKHYPTGMASHESVEYIFECGTKEPKLV